MNESRKTLLMVVAVVAILLAIYSGWRVFAGPRPMTEKERMTTTSGPVNPMSSILGPDASGKPRTQMPPGGAPVLSQPGAGGMSPMQRMMGGGGQPR